jgi:formylmethanofuran--tetrahydromethanopterin N-formyltransferase
LGTRVILIYKRIIKKLVHLKDGGTMKVNGVEIEDTYCEAFPMYFGRILITAATRRWALAAALEAKGLGTSSTMKPKAPGEAGIECEVRTTETPDGRPGYILLIGEPTIDELNYYLIARIRKGVVPVPTTATFDAMPKDMIIDYIKVEGTPIQLFGDGYEELVNIYNREMYKIPRMDGFYYIDAKFGITKGIGGGNFFILAESQAAALMAAEAAVNAIEHLPYVFVVGAYGGGPAASGTKVGGKNYKKAVATTNHLYCPCIRDKVPDTRVPADVRCVYEICIDGLTIDAVKNAIREGIKAAVKIHGIKKITAGNFGGKLGNVQIFLHEILK